MLIITSILVFHRFLIVLEKKFQNLFSMTLITTGGPLDMRILGLVKTRISGKSHIENQKAVIPYVHDFALICEKKITFAAVCLLINY